MRILYGDGSVLTTIDYGAIVTYQLTDADGNETMYRHDEKDVVVDLVFNLLQEHGSATIIEKD
jgi:hypothetical protein